MKKVMLLVGALAFVMALSCKKKETPVEEAPPATTPAPAPFTDGFKIEDNLGNIFISDSAVCYPDQSIYHLISYKGTFDHEAFENFRISIKKPPLKVKTYPLDSINLQGCYFTFGGLLSAMQATAGSMNISSLSSGKASGTFAFNLVPPGGGTSTRTLVTGIFNNIKIK